MNAHITLRHQQRSSISVSFLDTDYLKLEEKKALPLNSMADAQQSHLGNTSPFHAVSICRTHLSPAALPR